MSPYVALMRETGFMVRFAKALLQAIFGRINNYKAAWTPSAHAHYLRVQACFLKRFPTLRDPLTGAVVRKPTSAAEGDVLEHVAVALAHIEFRGAVQRLQANFSDYRLAGAEKLSTEQLFFISYADSACQAYDDERDFRFFLSRGESPSRQRVNVVLLYDATFHRAFRCRRGHAMVPSRYCSFW
ncbi:hypothetical protein HPB48_018668 [Haemaphysalis longicornis]|uniref:Peptidase M13 C-terminal domain-containing protein n=1 Tax=Haemaphysalis longicornis TaxID=44386 RepID=A0A9J6GFW2_HAELO|nr:hypothetical protein HPB48_018668 [Haemaphysalis longicornis]